MLSLPDEPPLPSLAHDPVLELVTVLGMRSTLHEPGRRDRYRDLLESAIERAEVQLARSRAPDEITALGRTLAAAHAAKAEDALYGAGQLSRGAQRAPTREACDDGWERVEAIVVGAAASARAALLVAETLEKTAPGSKGARAAHASARIAEQKARAARKLVDDRNHAYTFHTARSFSFGEGWYLAAAGVLAGVGIQIEPSTSGTVQAETFLRAAGLGERLVPYRPRPRAMKHVTAIVAAAFRVDPTTAQRKLRAAFLGDAPIANDVRAWIDQRLPSADAATSGRPKVLVWIRHGAHHPGRNTVYAELVALTERVRRAGLVPIFTGDSLRGETVPEGVVDMILFWKEPTFGGADMRLRQLHFFEHLRQRHGLVGQLGVTTAGMDGPALLGLPTLYFTQAPNVRMREWVGAVPGYEEIVQENDYLERVSRVLHAWAKTTPA